MNASFVVKVVGALAGIVTSAIGVGAGNAYMKSRKWGLEQLQNSRTGEAAAVFEEKEAAFVEASPIFAREDAEFSEIEKALKKEYNAAAMETNTVLARERNAVTRYRADMSTQHTLAERKCRDIKAAEESRLDDLLKHDGEYRAYKETRKIRKEAGKSLDKVEAKMERRKKELMETIETQRSEADIKAFDDRDFYACQMSNTDNYAESLIRQRSETDQAKFTRLKELSDELSDRKGRRSTIEAKRTPSEQAIVERYLGLKREAKAIEATEAESLDRLWAFGGYLKSQGWKPAEVAVLGSIPLLTVLGIVGYAAYKYLAILGKVVNAMKAV